MTVLSGDLGRTARRAQRPADYRGAAARDCDRILYTSAFRRLAHVTQVVDTRETQLFHNRLTHTLKVAQIGERLGEYLCENQPDQVERAGGIDPVVIRAACLAHDLGHPPFGHIAEAELQTILTDILKDTFEGNAQSFRIVTKLAWRSSAADEPALNLTRATLRAILKYPWLHDDDRAAKGKWGSYFSERDDFNFAMEMEAPADKSAEAALMDWADDIAYAVHDVEDFYRAGLIPLDRLNAESGSADEATAFIARSAARLADKGMNADDCNDAFARLRRSGLLPLTPYRGTREERESLHSFASALITRYIKAAQLLESGRLLIGKSEQYEVAVLKELTWFYVIDNPALASIQRGQRRLVRELFTELLAWANQAAGDKREEARLPRQFRELLKASLSDSAAISASDGDEGTLRCRATVDYVASLTEDQAIRLHQRLMGTAGSSALDVWLRA